MANTYDVFKIINLDDFNASGLVSKNLSLIFPGIGAAEVMVVQGNFVSIVYKDVFLTLGLDGKNPFEFGGYAAFVDPNNDVWLGILNES